MASWACRLTRNSGGLRLNEEIVCNLAFAPRVVGNRLLSVRSGRAGAHPYRTSVAAQR